MRFLLVPGLRFCNLLRFRADPDEPDVDGGIIAISGDCISTSSWRLREARLRSEGSDKKLSPGDAGSGTGGEVLGDTSTSSGGRLREMTLCMEDNDNRRRKVGEDGGAVGNGGDVSAGFEDWISSGCAPKETYEPSDGNDIQLKLRAVADKIGDKPPGAGSFSSTITLAAPLDLRLISFRNLRLLM